MQAVNRSRGRDVHLYHALGRGKSEKQPLGGLRRAAEITNLNFYNMTDVLFIGPYYLLDEEGHELCKDGNTLEPGNYYVTGNFDSTEDVCKLRPFPTPASTSAMRLATFQTQVRERDGRCVVTGIGREQVTYYGNYSGLEAAHVYPLSLTPTWDAHDFGVDGINSARNGILLSSTIHRYWDSYDISIDTKDNYKVVAFGLGYAGTGGHLSPEFINNPERPPDSLLNWHFKQAVLANMKDAGEPVLEFDFPEGSDMLGQILDGPLAGKRMEMELFSRFADSSAFV